MSDVLPVQSGHRGDPLKARIGARLLRRKRSAFKPKGVVFDPFTNQTEGVNAPAYTPYEIIKMVLMTPTAIARMVIFSLLMITTAAYLSCISCGRARKPGEPWVPPGCLARFLQPGVAILCRLMLLTLGFWWIDERFPADEALTHPSRLPGGATEAEAASGDGKADADTGGSPAAGTSVQRTGWCANSDGGCLWCGWCFRCDCTPFVVRPGAPMIIVANHTNFIDAIFIGTKTLPSIVSKAGNLRVPIVGTAIAALDPILVPHTDKERRTLPSVVAQIFERLGLTPDGTATEAAASDGGTTPKREAVPPLLMFPEGCIVNQTTVIEFQRGAFHPRLPVQPLAISYPFLSHDCSWTPDVAMPYLLFRLSTQLYNEMRVTWLPPVHPVPESETLAPAEPAHDPIAKPDPPKSRAGLWEHSARTQVAIARQLGVHPCTLSNSDSYLFQGAIRGGFAQYAVKHMLAQPDDVSGGSSGGFYTRVAQRHTKARMRDLIALARRFAEADSDNDGALSREEFVAHFAPTLMTAFDEATKRRRRHERPWRRRQGRPEAPSAAEGSAGTISVEVSGGAHAEGDAEAGELVEPVEATASGSGGVDGADALGLRRRLDVRRRTRLANALFDQLDRDGDGLLRWREMVIGLGAEATITGASAARGGASAGGAAEAGLPKICAVTDVAATVPETQLHSPISAADAADEAAEAATLEFQAELAFAVIDKNGDGFLDREDVRWAVVAMRRIRMADTPKAAGDAADLKPADKHAEAKTSGATEAVGEEGEDDDDLSPGDAMAAAESGRAAETGGVIAPPPLLRAVSAVEVRSEINRLFDAAASLPKDAAGEDGAEAVASGSAEGVISLDRFKRLVVSDAGARELLRPAIRTLREGVGVE